MIDPCDAAEAVRERISGTRGSLADEISSREIYFRVSIVGNCNLSCPFCHNEGGPNSGRHESEQIEPMLQAAAAVGFRRLQFTGGEPLLHKRIDEFVRLGRRHFPDVGVTTNGTLLPQRLPGLLAARITRVHVSLQRETLAPDAEAVWVLPRWLIDVALACRDSGAIVRLNLPVAHEDLSRAAEFLTTVRDLPLGMNLFALLPASDPAHEPDYLRRLAEVAGGENATRDALGRNCGRIKVREYIAPAGLRCGACPERSRCSEASRSLRFGVDGVLRPCLASRRWDFPLREHQLLEDVERAALLAVDY